MLKAIENAIGNVDGLVMKKLVLDREAWRSRINMIVEENVSSNSERYRTKSDIVVWCDLIEHRNILSRLVAVDCDIDSSVTQDNC
jgi:hypothetical protein